MRAEVLEFDHGGITCQFEPNLPETLIAAKRRYLGKSYLKSGASHFQFPPGLRLRNTHPDLLALAILLLSFPYSTSRSLEIPFRVTPEFRQAVHDSIGIHLKANESISVQPRVRGDKPGLAFSAGADSQVARLLMPANTVSIFLDRPLFFGRKSLYKKENIYGSINTLASRGAPIRVIETDFELMRNPVGFPVVDGIENVNLGVLAPLVLSADYFGFDSVAMGIVSDTFYRLGHEAYQDLGNHPYVRGFSHLFEMVGIPLYLPVGGLSEVVILEIAAKEGLPIVSCMRGSEAVPCRKCYKCFRKEMFMAELRGEPWSNKAIEALMTTPSVDKALAQHPILHGNVLDYFVERYPREPLHQLGALLAPYSAQRDWIGQWYPGAQAWVPADYLERHFAVLKNWEVQTMSPELIARLKDWLPARVRVQAGPRAVKSSRVR